MRIDAMQFAGLDQRGEHRPVLRPFIRTGEECVFSVESNHPVILPILGRKLKFTIPGTRSIGAVFGGITASSG